MLILSPKINFNFNELDANIYFSKVYTYTELSRAIYTLIFIQTSYIGIYTL